MGRVLPLPHGKLEAEVKNAKAKKNLSGNSLIGPTRRKKRLASGGESARAPN